MNSQKNRHDASNNNLKSGVKKEGEHGRLKRDESADLKAEDELDEGMALQHKNQKLESANLNFQMKNAESQMFSMTSALYDASDGTDTVGPVELAAPEHQTFDNAPGSAKASDLIMKRR